MTDGLLKKMYEVHTYAVKAINPMIIKRPRVYQQYVFSEKLARLCKNSEIPVLPAIEVNNQVIHIFQEKHHMIFPWVSGIALFDHDIPIVHCKKIAKVLAAIHQFHL